MKCAPALCVLLLIVLPAAAEDPLVAEARTREAENKTVDVTVAVREVKAPIAVTMVGTPPVMKFDVGPGEGTTLTSTNRMLIDGDRARVEFRHPNLAGGSKRLIPQTLIGVSDGRVAEVDYVTGVGDGVRTVIIQKDTAWPAGGVSAFFGPVKTHFRGARPELVGDMLSKARATGDCTAGDVPCTRYEYSPSENGTYELAVDAGAGHVIRRTRYYRGDKLLSETEVRYEAGRPAAWTTKQFTDAGATKVTTDVTASYAENSVATDADFTLSYPFGTKVIDQRDGSERTGPAVDRTGPLVLTFVGAGAGAGAFLAALRVRRQRGMNKVADDRGRTVAGSSEPPA